MLPRERLYHQLNGLTICGLDLRTARHDDLFKDIVYDLRGQRDRAYEVGYGQEFWKHEPHWPEHRLQVFVGLKEPPGYTAQGQGYNEHLLVDDLRKLLQFQADVRGHL